MGSPIESWGGAEAYFTFAHSSGMTGLFLAASVAIVAAVVVVTIKHENKSFARLNDKVPESLD